MRMEALTPRIIQTSERKHRLWMVQKKGLHQQRADRSVRHCSCSNRETQEFGSQDLQVTFVSVNTFVKFALLSSPVDRQLWFSRIR